MREESLSCEVVGPSDAVPLDVGSLVGCTLVGGFAGILAAAAVGSRYVGANPELAVTELVVPFALYVIATGACAFGGIRLALVVAPRWPVLAGIVSGALLGIAPGAWGAKTFGSQPLPFVGAPSFALAAIPFVLLGILAQTLFDGAGPKRALLASLGVTVAVFVLGAAAALATLSLGAPDMLDGLRELLFLGLDRVGALTGVAFGILVGGAQGLGVRLSRR
ncbi:MAG: hypothetical protein ACXVEE_39490 [Polyangiales bacterium]